MLDRLRNGAPAPFNPPACSHNHERVAQRVQRSRRKGARLAVDAVYVGRPTMWGNPFAYRNWGHAKATILHQRWLAGDLGALTLERMGFSPAEIDALGRLRERVLLQLHTLAGRDLACWCPTNSAWCHAQTLIDLARVHADYQRYAA